MTGADSNKEVEIKLRVESAAAARELLSGSGFEVRTPRHFESNVVYDTPALRLQSRDQLLRVRVVGEHPAVLTYKGPGEPGKHKSREEIELTLSDAGAFDGILHRLEMFPSFRYEKYRTEYERPGDPGHATLDETPVGVYVELEGPPAWIDATAKELGFSETAYIVSSYGRLYMEAREADPGLPRHMVFPARDRRP
jgi:adenylate cyclase class 2